MKQHRNATSWFDRVFFINISENSEKLDGTVATNPLVNSLPVVVVILRFGLEAGIDGSGTSRITLMPSKDKSLCGIFPGHTWSEGMTGVGAALVGRGLVPLSSSTLTGSPVEHLLALIYDS